MKPALVFWTKLKKKLVEVERFANGRNFHTSFVIIDSKNIKNTDTAKEKGYDAGKKISGIKLKIFWDYRKQCT